MACICAQQRGSVLGRELGYPRRIEDGADSSRNLKKRMKNWRF